MPETLDFKERAIYSKVEIASFKSNTLSYLDSRAILKRSKTNIANSPHFPSVGDCLINPCFKDYGPP